MENKKFSHEDLQKNIVDLKSNSYLYHEGYVYYSTKQSGGGRDATGWVGGGEVYKRVKDDGTEVTVFNKTFNDDCETASSRHSYYYSTPTFNDGYVHFKITHKGTCEVEGDYENYNTYKVKADGISNLE